MSEPKADISIPAESLEAGARAQALRDNVDWDRLNDIAKDLRLADQRACFLAMLKAWPGMDRDRVLGVKADEALILPLPQEAQKFHLPRDRAAAQEALAKYDGADHLTENSNEK